MPPKTIKAKKPIIEEVEEAGEAGEADEVEEQETELDNDDPDTAFVNKIMKDNNILKTLGTKTRAHFIKTAKAAYTRKELLSVSEDKIRKEAVCLYEKSVKENTIKTVLDGLIKHGKERAEVYKKGNELYKKIAKDAETGKSEMDKVFEKAHDELVDYRNKMDDAMETLKDNCKFMNENITKALLLIISDDLRNQFNALKDKFDNIPNNGVIIALQQYNAAVNEFRYLTTLLQLETLQKKYNALKEKYEPESSQL